ncbi:MAG: cytochrome P450 [Gammaproteobacteria bacterium]|jgi:cytochrome P450|nr:cytochrome P450 [Gammaproteobacteria bacterium]MBT4618600.1 cytochrome P450 [Gammaproteobacteria bacterium]MBT5196075.1 cytochrome P450 [Gammaproteobacteria bacterium]MBT5444908.1 cytochrome P450 [Gammaproteobacteria bacterium]MBT5792949.1 cytochrome P450 [Gammaproteobacteria bacterium]
MSESSTQLFSPENLIDPYPAYKKLRDEAPVHFMPEMNLHVVTRYDLLREAIKRTDDFSSKYDQFLGGAQQMMFMTLSEEQQAEAMAINEQMVEIPPTMLTLDEPEHTQYRSLVSKLFTASQVRKSEDSVRAVINKNITAMKGTTAADFMGLFASPVPLEIISDRLGIPDEDRAFFYEAAAAAAAGLKMAPVPPEVLIHRMQLGLDLQRLLIKLIEARRAEPREDMITILANSKLEVVDRQLTHGEILSVLNQFLVAGHETTTSTFGWGMLALCDNPAIQEQIRGDEKRVKTFIEEVLRIEAPVQGLPRLVARDTELGGYPLKKGDMMMLRYGAANRDERQFANPDSVDVDREKAGMQMAFGSGVHHCIGAPLARQELNIGFYQLVEHFSDFQLDPSKGRPVADPSFILRGLPQLHVNYKQRP